MSLKKQHINLVTNYNEIVCEAQSCPIAYSARKDLAVCTVEVPVVLTSEMKEQEKGNIIFIEKI